MALEGIFQQLQRLGFLDVFLPFVLIFTIVFAVMQKVKILGDKRYNVVIALVVAAVPVMSHVLWGTGTSRLSNGLTDVIYVINTSLPSVSVIVVAIVMALIIIGVLGRSVDIGDSSLSGIIAFVAFAVIVFVFGGSAGWWQRPSWLRILDDPEVMALVIVVLVFAIIIWFITKDDTEREEDQKIFSKFGKMLKEPPSK